MVPTDVAQPEPLCLGQLPVLAGVDLGMIQLSTFLLQMACWRLTVVDIMLYQLTALLDVVATGLLTLLTFVGIMLKQLPELSGVEVVLPATPTNIFIK